MGRDMVQVWGNVPLAPEAVWSVVRDFCGAWHPWVTSIAEERGPQGARVLTHCNAGALATGGYGTALGVLRGAREAAEQQNRHEQAGRKGP